VFSDALTQKTSIAVFSTLGTRQVVAREGRGALPVASVRLAGERVVWTVRGARHSAGIAPL
jgi:hypothetical protein